MKILSKLLTCDEPSQYTGRIYSREAVQQMVEDSNFQLYMSGNNLYAMVEISDPSILNKFRVSPKMIGSVDCDTRFATDLQFIGTELVPIEPIPLVSSVESASVCAYNRAMKGIHV